MSIKALCVGLLLYFSENASASGLYVPAPKISFDKSKSLQSEEEKVCRKRLIKEKLKLQNKNEAEVIGNDKNIKDSREINSKE